MSDKPIVKFSVTGVNHIIIIIAEHLTGSRSIEVQNHVSISVLEVVALGLFEVDEPVLSTQRVSISVEWSLLNGIQVLCSWELGLEVDLLGIVWKLKPEVV